MHTTKLCALLACVAIASVTPAAATQGAREVIVPERPLDVRVSSTERSVGRVRFAAPMPGDETLSVHMEVHVLGAGEQLFSPENVKSFGLEWEFRPIATAAVEEDGRFSFPRIIAAPENTYVRVRLEGRYLYADDILYVRGGDGDPEGSEEGGAKSELLVDAKLGALVTIQLQLPADATAEERAALIGRPIRLKVVPPPTNGFSSSVLLREVTFGRVVEEGLEATFGGMTGDTLRYDGPIDLSTPEESLSPFYVASRGRFGPTIGASETVVLRLERGIRVSGRVVDEHGVPFPGATVRAVGKRQSMDGWYRLEWPSSTSREDGTFELNALRPDIGTLSAVSYRSVGQVLTAAALEDALENPDDIVLTVRTGRTLHGLVRLPDGQPLADTVVRLVTEQQPGMWSPWHAKTDAEGRFTATGFLDHAVEVSIDGWHLEGAMSLNARREGQRLLGFASVLPGETSLDQPATIDLAAARVLKGRVIDPTGGPLQACWLYMGGETLVRNRGSFAARTNSLGAKRFPVDQATGEFEIHDVPGGPVGVFAQLGHAKHPRSSPLVTLEQAELDEPLELVLDVLHSVEGVVRTSDGGALADARVIATKVGTWSKTSWRVARSDSGGTFELVDLPEGMYELTVDHRAWLSERPVEVHIRSDRPMVRGVVVPVVTGGFVEVLSLWASERDSTHQGPFLFDDRGESVLLARKTERSSAGKRLLGPILPGKYTVAVSRDSLGTRSRTWMRQEVEIIAGAPAMVTFNSNRVLTSTVTGRTSDVNGRPLEGYTVTARRDGLELATMTTDHRGRFSLSVQGTEPVTIELFTYYPTQRLRAIQVDLIENATVEIDLTVGTGEIHGSLDAGYLQHQASGTVVDVVPEGGDASVHVEGRSVPVLYRNGFRILHLEPGTYTLVAWRRAPGERMERGERAAKPKQVTIRAGERRKGIVLEGLPSAEGAER